MNATRAKKDYNTPLERSRRMMRRGVPSYGTAHVRMRRDRGRASGYTCIGCGATAADWAYDHADPEERFCTITGNAFSVDAEHYDPMCRSCHVTLDRNQPVARRYKHPRRPSTVIEPAREPAQILDSARARLADIQECARRVRLIA